MDQYPLFTLHHECTKLSHAKGYLLVLIMDLFSILDTLDNLLLKLPAPAIGHVKPVKQGWGVSKTNPEILYLLYF